MEAKLLEEDFPLSSGGSTKVSEQQRSYLHKIRTQQLDFLFVIGALAALVALVALVALARLGGLAGLRSSRGDTYATGC